MSARSFLSALAGIAALLLLVSGCASLTTPPVPPPPRDTLAAFSLEGRFALNHETRSYSGRISWTYRPNASELLLSSPFGQGLAEIVTDADGARLTGSDGSIRTAPDAETLTREVLGYPLPLKQLADWVRGRTPPGSGRLDPLGRVLSLQQDGWLIDYGYGDDAPGSPPLRISARQGENVELRIFIDAWQSISPEEVHP